MTALTSIPESPRTPTGGARARNEADMDVDGQKCGKQEVDPGSHPMDAIADDDVLPGADTRHATASKQHMDHLLKFQLQPRPQTSGSDILVDIPFEPVTIPAVSKAKAKGQNHAQDVALLGQGTMPRRGHSREFVPQLPSNDERQSPEVQQAPSFAPRQMVPPFSHAPVSMSNPDNKKQKSRKKTSQNSVLFMTEPNFPMHVNQHPASFMEHEASPSTSTSVIGTGSVSTYPPVLPRGKSITEEGNVLHEHDNSNPQVFNASNPRKFGMRGDGMSPAVNGSEHSHQVNAGSFVTETAAQQGSAGFRITHQMLHNDAAGGPELQVPHNQRVTEQGDPNDNLTMNRNARCGPIDRSEVSMSRVNTLDTVESDGQIVHKPNRQHRSKTSLSRASQNVPSIPEVLTVLGYAITSQLGQTENARMARDAETIELKATITKLELHVAHLTEQRAVNLEKEKAHTEQMKDYKAKALKSQKYLTGLNNDIEYLRVKNKELKELIKDVQAASEPALFQYNSAAEHAKVAFAQLGDLKTKTFEQLREAQGLSRQLEDEKVQLESQVQLQAQELRSLTHERNQIKSQLKQRSETSAQLDNLLNTNRDVLLEKLTELATTFEGVKDTTASEQIAEIANKVHSLSKVSPDASDEFRQSMVELESRLIGRMDELQDTATLSAHNQVDPSNGIEEHVRHHLSQIKDDVLAWQTSQQQASDLREEKAALTEQLKFREQQVTELTRRIEVMEQQQDVLLKNNAHLLEQTQLRPVGREAEIDPQELADLKTDLESIQSTLMGKDHELEELRAEMNAAKSKYEEETLNIQRHFAKEAIRDRKDMEAEFDNKLRTIQIKYKKTQQDQSGVIVAGYTGARRAGLLQGSSKAIQDDYESRILTLQKDHEAKQLAMRNEHQAALTQLQRDHEAHVADQIKAVEKVAEARMQDAERKHNEAHFLEKQELEERISTAENEKNHAVKQLKEANRAANEWKEKFELAQTEANKPQETMPRRDPGDANSRDEDDTSEPTFLRLSEAGHRIYGQPSRMEVRSATKVPVHFGESLKTRPTKRSINRAQPVRPQSQDSMLFQDEVEEEENDKQQEEETAPERLALSSKAIQSAPQDLDRFRTDAQQKERNEYDFRSSPPFSASLNRRGADVLAGARSDEPRANSSQRMVPSTDVNTRGGQTSKAVRPKEVGPAGNTRSRKTSVTTDPTSSKNAPTQKSTTQMARKRSSDHSKVLVKNSQAEIRKRPSSPNEQADPRKRNRANPASAAAEQGRSNAFTQHNEIQRTRSRDGIFSRPGTGASLTPAGLPVKRIKSGASTRSTSTIKVPKPAARGTTRAVTLKKRKKDADMDEMFRVR